MQRNLIEEKIISAQIEKGVDQFWANVALNQIRQVLATDCYFVNDIVSIKVTLDSLNISKIIVIKTICVFPNAVDDSGYKRLDKTIPGVITYKLRAEKAGVAIGPKVTHKF